VNSALGSGFQLPNAFPNTQYIIGSC